MTAEVVSSSKAADRPLVSVVVVSYNYARYIEQCLESVAQQTHHPIQLIVVDDSSTDDSVEVIRQWAARTPLTVEVVVHESNRGMCAALNTGLARVRGVYVAPLSSDDYWKPEKLEIQVALFERLPPDYGVVYGGMERVDESGNRIPAVSTQAFYAPEGDVFRSMVSRPILIASSGLIKRSCFDLIGPCDELLCAEDRDMNLRLARRFRFAYSPERSTYRRVHVTSHGNRQRGTTAAVETGLLALSKHIGASNETDRFIKPTVLNMMITLYGAPGSRFDLCFERAFGAYRHPLLLCLKIARTLHVPGATVRFLWNSLLAIRRSVLILRRLPDA